MAEVKFTKTELRGQQLKLDRLMKYLPTLQLKKAMLQSEVNNAQAELDLFLNHFTGAEERVAHFSRLLSDRGATDLFAAVTIAEVQKGYENIAGVEIPHFQKVIFAPSSYSLFDTPVWLDSAIDKIQKLLTLREQIRIAREKKRALEKELREVSIRVNLFEKIMIPRAQENIKKIKIFLGDQQLAAVCQAKVAKKKIEERNR